MEFTNKRSLKDLKVEGKRVIVRVDFNVPFKDNIIGDDNRIKASLPTIKYLANHGAKIILLSHLGRIKSEEDKKTKSLRVVGQRLSELLDGKVVRFVAATRGPLVEKAVQELKPGEIVLLENTRFEDVKNGELVKYESKNHPELGKYWASLGDIFINDAFGTSHRSHASNVGIASNIKNSALGLLVGNEVEMLAKGIEKPQRPFVAILGGAKVSDKIGVIDNLLNKVDKILIGGGMAYTFLKAAGHNIGTSLFEADKLKEAKAYLEKAGDKIVLPIDSAASRTFANTKPTYFETDIPDDHMGLDIGPKTVELFNRELKNAKTVIWNGPMGVNEFSHYAVGTKAVAQQLANLKNAFTLIGGGDSAAAAISLGFKDKFSWISTGGGASLEYMEGKILPGIASVQNK